MRVFFLSDLHLENDHSSAARRFISFLRNQPEKGDDIALGGDIFDLLVGDKRIFRERYREAIEAIEAAGARGVVIHYVEGNHDFHFQRLFAGRANVHVYTRDFELFAHGRRIWVSHGDLIDEEDTGYRLLRAFTKNIPFAAFVAAVPGSFVDFLGTRSSGASRKYTTGRVENEGTKRLRRIYLGFAEKKVSEGITHVLVGHSHLRDQIQIRHAGATGEYVNLGFSAEKLVYGVLEEGQEFFSIREHG